MSPNQIKDFKWMVVKGMECEVSCAKIAMLEKENARLQKDNDWLKEIVENQQHGRL